MTYYEYLIKPFYRQHLGTKKSPRQLLQDSNGEAIAILNHNKPTAYLVPAEKYEMMLDRMEDIELAKIIQERESEKPFAVAIALDELYAKISPQRIKGMEKIRDHNPGAV